MRMLTTGAVKSMVSKGTKGLIRNEVGIQMPPDGITRKLFPATQRGNIVNETQLKNVRKHLSKFGIDCQSKFDEELAQSHLTGLEHLEIPELEGRNLSEHFWSIALEQVLPYTRRLNEFLSEPDGSLELPSTWPDPTVPGWHSLHRGSDVSWQAIDYPKGNVMVLDVEVVSAFNLPVIAVALSPSGWYIWISAQLCNPDLSRYSSGLRLTPDDLIDIEGTIERADGEGAIIIGHNVGFDRSYLRSQYNWANDPGRTRFLDTLSLHVACSGLGSNQRQTYQFLKRTKGAKKGRELIDRPIMFDSDDQPSELENVAQLWADSTARIRHSHSPQLGWLKESGANNLADVLALYCPSERPLVKDMRSVFTSFKCSQPITEITSHLKSMFHELCVYCANDVAATFNVARKLFPLFLDRFPNPVTLAGMLEMSTMILPVNEQAWYQYISRSTQIYEDTSCDMNKLLCRHADDACSYLLDGQYKSEPWLKHLNWETQPFKLLKKPSAGKKRKQNKASDEGPELQPVFEGEVNSDLHSFLLECRDEFAEEISRLYTDNVSHVLRSSLDYLPKRPPTRAGYPKWYRDLCLKESSQLALPDATSLVNSSCISLCEQTINSPLHGAKQLTIRNQITPYLLRLLWGGNPVHYNRKRGWGFLAGYREKNKTVNGGKLIGRPHSSEPTDISPMFDPKDDKDDLGDHKLIFDSKVLSPNHSPVLQTSDEFILPEYSEGPFKIDEHQSADFYKISHPTGKLDSNVGNPLSKSFHGHAFSGLLDTNDESLNLLELVNQAQMIAYWENSLGRICSQFPLTFPTLPSIQQMDALEEDEGCIRQDRTVWSAIVPRTIVCGTVTRRAVERTWLTASNPREDRIGSELKCMMQTPESHRFVGADVDSQEMWIASLLGDAISGIHGSSACSWMLLNGSKSDGNDLHSHIANSIGISRDHAKVLNYARIYGAGASYATRLLCAFNPKLSAEDARKKVALMYRRTKGVRTIPSDTGHQPWVGGSESDIFNALEEIATSCKPCTPVLGARMTRALEPRNVGGDFMTSRVNWAVQSSAVDYLHLLLTCMRWLDVRRKLSGEQAVVGDANEDNNHQNRRLAISIHDEIRYICDENCALQAAHDLQIANLLTRAMFTYQVLKTVKPDGSISLPSHAAPPLSVCFFSSIEIDKCLRKEAHNQCVTPSNPLGLSVGYGIEPGQQLGIQQIIELVEKRKTDGN